jgi:hypothetical protein
MHGTPASKHASHCGCLPSQRSFRLRHSSHAVPGRWREGFLYVGGVDAVGDGDGVGDVISKCLDVYEVWGGLEENKLRHGAEEGSKCRATFGEFILLARLAYPSDLGRGSDRFEIEAFEVGSGKVARRVGMAEPQKGRITCT